MMTDPTETGPRTPTWYVGLHLPNPDGVIQKADVDTAVVLNYELVTSYITNKKFRSRVVRTIELASDLDREVTTIDSLVEEEVSIHPGDHMSQVIAFTSPWLDLDSDDPLIAHISKEAFKHEIAYAAFCGLNHVVVAGPKQRAKASQYAQAISSALSASAYMQLLIQMPVAEEELISIPAVEEETKGKALNTSHDVSVDALSTWDAWNTIRTICKYNTRLGLALQLPVKLPPQRSRSLIDRWFSEPVRLLMILTENFLPNARGFPVLSKSIQHLLSKCMKTRPTPFIVLAGTQYSERSSNGHEISPSSPAKQKRPDSHAYLSYIRHLQKSQPPLSAVETFGAGYQDYLQAPLQPLADNLESLTYEVFEKDPVKYDQYEKAMRSALEGRDANDISVIAVVGAGRGPLVSRALRAAEATGRNIELYAIEKNPNAYITLLRHNRETWGGRVTIVKSDMRDWSPPFQVDILVSELLGSFGDNELSPECLDGVQRVLNSEGGIMIPASYSAHFTPLMAPKIYADISNRMAADSSAAETPYVVMLHSVQLLAENEYIHKAWEFSHPISPETLDIGAGTVGSNDHNKRFTRHTFKIPDRGVIHGLGGYFESVLFGNVELSTRPDTIDTKSKDMISWFPIYFPLKVPLYVPDSAEVEISMWRLTDERKVWYEWVVETYVADRHGVRCRLATTDLHSSIKSGCLM